MQLDTITGLIDLAQHIESPNCDERAFGGRPEAVVIHCISLPPGDYQGDAVLDFFTNRLNVQIHSYFEQISHLRVSAHFFIRRDGLLVQFVPTHKRAWHAGESVCLGKPMVNDFSIGIELEGLDTDPEGFTDPQYRMLNKLLACLRQSYPQISEQSLFAHSDIAPGRKSDPGQYFKWLRVIEAQKSRL